MNNKQKNVMIKIDEEYRKLLKIYAIQRGLTMSEFIEALLDEYKGEK